MTLQRRSFALVLAAPSGAGKTSLARALVERHENIVFSISATTRPARPFERDGRDYVFASDDEFNRMVVDGELVEWAVVHGNKYGTPWESIRKGVDGGHVVVLDIDVQGARQIRQKFDDAVLVFILPPSASELERRLRGRGSEAEAAMRLRMRTSLSELPAIHEFDYVVVNEEFDRTLGALEAIVAAERLRVRRATGLDEAIATFGQDIRSILERE